MTVAADCEWRTWDERSKQKLAARLRAQLIAQGKAATFCDDATPSAMAKRLIGERWNHRAYHDVLDQLAVDMLNGDLDRGTISMPPQTGKSTWVNWFVLWWQAKRPTEPIIRMSYAASLAVTLARSVQDNLETYGGQFGLVPKARDWKQDAWETVTGAALRSGGMLTGVSGHPAALLIIDDPFAGRAWADSKVIRDKTYNEYSGSLISRLRPKSPILVVCTRWHEDDIVARVTKNEGVEREGGRWREINLPALATSEHDPLGRKIGDPLPHPWIDPDDTEAQLKHWLERKRISTLRDWFSLYQGDPKPVEGALLTEDQVKAATWMGEELPPFVRTGVAIDPSGGGRDVAGVIGGGVTRDGRVIWTHDRSKRMKSEEWSVAACELAHEIDANVMVYEHNYGGDQAELILRTVWKQLSEQSVADGNEDWGPCPAIEAVHAKKGKRVRAEPIAAQVTFGMIYFWALKVLDLGSEWQTWQEDSSESPGRIDAACYLAYKWLKIPGSEVMYSSIASQPSNPLRKSPTASTQIQRARPGWQPR